MLYTFDLKLLFFLIRSGMGEDDPQMLELRKSLAASTKDDVLSQMEALRKLVMLKLSNQYYAVSTHLPEI